LDSVKEQPKSAMFLLFNCLGPALLPLNYKFFLIFLPFILLFFSFSESIFCISCLFIISKRIIIVIINIFLPGKV